MTDGDGAARTPSGEFAGASIRDAELIGWLNADRDGSDDAVVSFVCFGSPFAQCCAGARDKTLIYPNASGGDDRRVLHPHPVATADLGYSPDATTQVAHTFTDGLEVDGTGRWVCGAGCRCLQWCVGS